MIDGGHVHRIVSEAGRLYALGSSRSDETDLGNAAIWSSVDGLAWERVILPFPASWDRDPATFVFARELAAVDGRLLAIGIVGFADYLNVVVWESSDGLTWSEVDTGPFMVEAYSATDVTNGPGGLVVTSHHYVSGSASAWRSTDGGHSWIEHRPTGEYLEAWAVVGTSSGYIMAGSVAEGTVDEPHPRIWGSPDGADWAVLSVEGSDGLGMVEQITVSGSGRWAALGTLNGHLVAWWSEDGQSWNLAGSLSPIEAGYPANVRLIGLPDGFIGVNTTLETSTWASGTGESWAPQIYEQPGGLQGEGIELAAGIARLGDVVLVAGNDYGSQGADFGWVTWTGLISR